MQDLKQSTAATVLVGPVLDPTGDDYSGMVIGDFNITKNGTTAAMAAAASVTHSHEGFYLLVFTTGNTDTIGRLDISCNKAGYTMVPARFSVLHANVFDVWYGSVALATVSNITAAAGIAVSSIGAGVITASSIASDAITAAKIADDAITAGKIATDAIGSDEISAAAVTKIQTGLATPTNITAGVITTVTNLTNAPANGDLTATMKASVNAEVDTALADYDAPTKAELDTGLDALPTATENATGLLDLSNAVETGVTVRNSLRLMAAGLGGKVSGMEDGEPVFRNIGDTKDVITAVCDADNNRTSVVTDLT